MDFDSHSTPIQPPLCNVVSCGEVPIGSMMALMTEQEQENDEQLMATAVHGAFTYYNPPSEPYLQAALFQAAQALHIHQVEPHTSESHFAMHQVDEHDVVLAQASANRAKTGHSSKLGGHFSRRRDGHSESSLLGSSAGGPLHDPRVSSASLDLESTCMNVSETDSIRAKIMGHPHFPRLVAAYMNCHKVGAPPDVVTSLDELLSKEYQNFHPSRSCNAIGTDPELDQFMETYCNMLQKYYEELTKPFKEAMAFFRKIELQLNSLSKGSLRLTQSVDDKIDMNGSSEEEDASCGELDYYDVDPIAGDNKIKEQLLRKYSGYIYALKQEFMKKKKKGKLPKEARQKLLDWWCQHYKWPYPSETEKAALAETTGLDQKQINNWFINQRKRHWKPSEDMQYVMVDSPGSHPAMTFVEASMKHEAGTIAMMN